MATRAEPETGQNRTGIARSRARGDEMIDATRHFAPSPEGDELLIAEARSEFTRAMAPMGSVPPPPTMKGLAKAAAQKLRSIEPAQLIDKLGERLAFERAGVRVYEALLSKLEAAGDPDEAPERAEVTHILREEYEHFRSLDAALRHLGADPTALTPSANLSLTMASGIVASVVDPRTSFSQCLDAVLVLELADNESWELLVQLAREAGQRKLVDSFERAAEQEREHLMNVREWVASAQHVAG